MLIFSISSSTKYISMSLYKDGVYLSDISVKSDKSHTNNIVEIITKFFKWSNVKYDDVDIILLSTGPGSFTGIRVSMSLIKAMFHNTNVKIYEITEFIGYYEKFKKCFDNYNDKVFVSIVDGQKDKVYTNIRYKNDNVEKVFRLDELLEYLNLKYKDLEICIIGDANIRHSEYIVNYFEKNNMKIICVDFNYNYIDSKSYVDVYNNNSNVDVNISNLKPYYLENIEINGR